MDPVLFGKRMTIAISPLYFIQDSLTISQPDPYQQIVKTLLSVQPGQAEIIVNLIEALLPHLEEK